MEAIELEIRVAGEALHVHVVHARGEESLSEDFRVTITFDPGPAPNAAGATLDARTLPGCEATLWLRAPSGAERRLGGVVRAARSAVIGKRRAVVIELVPRAALLAIGRQCRSFDMRTVPEVASDILREAGVAHRLALTHDYERHPYLAQYREDDATFVRRLLAGEGIVTYFDFAADETTLVLCDSGRLCPDIPARTLAWKSDAGLDAAREHVLEAAFEGEALPTRVTVGSWSARRPDLLLRESEGAGARELYVPPGAGPELPEGCRRRARLLLDDFDGRRRVLRASATSPELCPGHRFALQGSAFDDAYVVIASSFEVRARERFDAGAQGAHARGAGAHEQFRVRFAALPAARALRPSPAPEPRHLPGLQGGIVVGARGQEIHPDPEGRVRVRLHWDVRRGADEVDGTWMRVVQRASAESLLLPRMGWTVLTSWEDGSGAAPEVLARIFDGEHRPPYALPEHRTRVVLKTATSPHAGTFNEICFEDAEGREDLGVHAARDLNLLVERSASNTVGHDRTASAGRDLAVQVALRTQELVGGDQTTDVAGSQALEVCGALGQPVGGSLTEVVGGARFVTTASGAARSAAKTRSVKVGAAQIDASAGKIGFSAAGPFVHAVGGVALRVAKQGVSETAGRDSREAVGALRLEKAARGYYAVAENDFAEQAAAGITLVAGGRYVDGSTTSADWTVGGTFSLDGTTLVIEATERIELVAGASTLTLLPDGIEIAAPALDLSQADVLAAETLVIEHN